MTPLLLKWRLSFQPFVCDWRVQSVWGKTSTSAARDVHERVMISLHVVVVAGQCNCCWLAPLSVLMVAVRRAHHPHRRSVLGEAATLLLPFPQLFSSIVSLFGEHRTQCLKWVNALQSQTTMMMWKLCMFPLRNVQSPSLMWWFLIKLSCCYYSSLGRLLLALLDGQRILFLNFIPAHSVIRNSIPVGFCFQTCSLPLYFCSSPYLSISLSLSFKVQSPDRKWRVFLSID